MQIQKYAKSCYHKTTWAIIFYLLEASGAPALTLQLGGWDYLASSPGHSQIYLAAVEKNPDFSPQLQDKSGSGLGQG